MVSKKKCVAMLLAGGQGTRLYALTQKKAKPAVEFGGKYRIIDFPLSNCTNSGIDTVGVLTQYEPMELNAYIGNGAPWDLDGMSSGAFVLPPYVKGKKGEWYEGTANAIYQNINFIDRYNPDYVLVLSGDHIYKMDYNAMIKYHEEQKADATIAVMAVPIEEASRFGVMNTDADMKILEFEEKPPQPKSNTISMGIYVFTWSKMRKYLIEDAEDEESEKDFGKNIIPNMLDNGERMYAYLFDGYWKDVGTFDSLWETNMELLEADPALKLDDDKFRIYTRNYAQPAHFVSDTAVVNNSIIADGCVIEGEVDHCVLHAGVKIGKGTKVKDSIIMSGTSIGENCLVYKSVMDSDIRIEDGAVIGGTNGGITVIGSEAVVGKNAKVDEGAMIAPNQKID